MLHSSAKALAALAISALIAPIAAQEPAYSDGKQVVRFDEGADNFRYILPCYMPADTTPASAATPASPGEPALCWPAVAGLFHTVEGKVDGTPSVAGMLIVSAHNVRFAPKSATDQSMFFNFPAASVIRQTGLPDHQFIIFTDKKDSFFRLFLTPSCVKCVPGTAASQEMTPQLATEVKLVIAATQDFDSVYRAILAVAHLHRVEISPANQPTLTDPHDAMRLYSELNRKLLPLCPEAARSCIQSYADYQACKASSSTATCAGPPTCSASCGLTDANIVALHAPMCTAKTEDHMTLYPDWTDVAKKMEEARRATPPPASGNKIELIQEAPGTPPKDFMGKPLQPGCTVESGYSTAMMQYMTRDLRAPNGGAIAVGTGSAPVLDGSWTTGPALISGGVIAGNILTKVQPVYPAVARAAHISGAVVLHAIISPEGTISDLQVISGPDLLRAAALEAVRQWTYKPYLLLGKPIAVDTTITVNFNIGSPAANPQTTPQPGPSH